MPSRKKDRGKQRKARQSSNGLDRRTSPMGTQIHRNLGPAVKEFMAEGCRVVLRDNGSCSSISHPCFKHIEGGTTTGAVKDFDRGLLNDKERQELAENYVHNFAQDLREGDYHAMDVMMRNLTDPNITPQLVAELLKVDIHLTFRHYLNQSDRSISDVLGRVVDAKGSAKLPFFWVGILATLMQYGLSVDADALDGMRSKVARDIGPFVTAMMDEKREIFQSNLTWHVCLTPFFLLVCEIMKSKGGFLVMISYEGLLPFVAQASCWSQSRLDIASESEIIRQLYPDPRPLEAPEPLALTSHEAQNVLAVAIHAHYDAEQEDLMSGALDQIACTRLLSNNPECNDSTTVGLVRMLDKSIHRGFLFESIVQPLLLEHGYVDAGVITELIEFGKRNQSMAAAETVLNSMVAILGRDNSYEHIERIDSRYAAAVRSGLLEYCIGALVAHGNETGSDIGYIAMGVWSMAMHSKTSRALRKKEPEIATALDVLRKHSTASRSNAICRLIDGAIDLSAPATCYNCLKEVNRKELLYCKRCGVECYCSPECQSESYALGYDKVCTEAVQVMDDLMRKQGLSETELKRWKVLSCNLMMNGCRLVRSKAAEFLDEKEGHVAKVTIDFGDFPPDVEVSWNKKGECSGSGSLKCTFKTPVYYGFAKKGDVEEAVLQKVISRRSLVDPGVGARVCK